MKNKLTKFGDRLSDKISSFGGSWKFIISFIFFLNVWIVINILIKKPFDPYPFILLNLLLSCVAALQAPLILMSQNRLESKDRARSIKDHELNLQQEKMLKATNLKLENMEKMLTNILQEIEISNKVKIKSQSKIKK